MADKEYAEIERCIQLLIRHKVLESSALQPCPEMDVTAIARFAGGSLPSAYAYFLRRMGRGAGHFMASESFFYPTLLELRGIAEELVAENSGKLTLPENAVVINVHQGYEYEFFVCGEGDDPPIYQCYEGHVGIAFIWPSFTSFFCDMVGQYVN